MASEFPSPDIATLKRSSDEDVLVALREGRMSALDVLYDRYAKQVYSLAYRILASTEEAEDITQEVFLTLWQKDTYQSSRGSLKTFLITLTRSRSIDRLRHQGTRHRFLQRWQRLSASEQETAPPLDDVSVNEQSHLLQEALTVLSDSEREILEIAYYEGISQTEIAKRLNLPLGTVKSRSRQGLNKLRQHLQNLR
ncbi:sigma-70 family RNA polymerase sigma factor [Oscillatoria sp. FACHB-1407]|uniref:sigma-70 family RNA polymerase sigma factor n=1 Tax=Oscillatoria sp. FACHB-1407 TaxID=2692847 RepID=UPI0016830C59|nr:sigma-70 family RNA polymerase sigma factor [Oscillatoria sp. FACHB-1407]MBD2464450.1 sigma-70 family RNA polymerase sigma factor [Oscillatoria sp. FACHB-1407]